MKYLISFLLMVILVIGVLMYREWQRQQPTIDFSPTGEWIAYTCTRGASTINICIIRPDGTENQRLTFTDTYQFSDWSPQGDQMLVNRDTYRSFVTLKPDGSNQQVLDAPPTHLPREMHVFTSNISHPQFSPDGEWIAFVAPPIVYAMRADGSSTQSDVLYIGSYQIDEIQWLSSETLLVNEKDENRIRTYTIVNIGTGENEVLDFPFEDPYPREVRFSPLGNYIAYKTEDHRDLIVHELDTGHVQRLTINPEDRGSWLWVWSPDEHEILVSRYTGEIRFWNLQSEEWRIIEIARQFESFAGAFDWISFDE